MFQVEVAKLSRQDLESYLRPLIQQSTDPMTLRAFLEEVANANRYFPSLAGKWGPEVYRRNPVVFRPLILSQFAFMFWDGWKLRRIPWHQSLDAWLAKVESNEDTALSRLLIHWKLCDQSNGRFWPEPAAWRAELIRRFEAVSSRSKRMTELEKMSFVWGILDEPTALRIYDRDPESARKFIMDSVPSLSYWGKREFWERLIERARKGGDNELAQTLYRKQVPQKRWAADAVALCRSVSDSSLLLAELEKMYPLSTQDLGAGMAGILETRGRDVVPFVMRHMSSVFTGWLGRGEFGRVLKIASANGWWDLWSCAVRTCATEADYNKELKQLLGNRAVPESEVRNRLLALAGVSREWNFSGFGIATIHNLDEGNSLALYDRFPDLLRGPFKLHLQDRWSKFPRTKLIDRLIGGSAVADEEVLDFLASRYITNSVDFESKKMVPEVEQLAECYLALRENPRTAATFARRAAAVLGQIPAFAIPNYPSLIRGNGLARLLFERSLGSYLADERAVADLVEASEIHVMAMAYRILSLDDGRAQKCAVQHLPLLLGTLLRPMQRATRMAAFGALLNAAATSAEAGRTILGKAREALALPDKKYPKEELAGLIGKVIYRWPELRGTKEVPMVYRRTYAA